jgi:hypothetical protein
MLPRDTADRGETDMQVKARFVLTSFLTVITLAATGCGRVDAGTDDTGGLPLYAAEPTASTVAARAVSPSGQSGAAAAPSRRLLKSMSLTTEDVESLDLVARPPAGHTSLAEPTLESCRDDFPSESHRTARHAVTGWVEEGEPGITVASNVVDSEIVTYDSEEWAQRALEEWRAAVEDCRLDRADTLLALVPDLDVGGISQEPDPSLPIRDNAVTTVEVVENGKPFADLVTVHQRHRNFLVVLDYEEASELSAAELERLRGLAGVLGRRVLAKAG